MPESRSRPDVGADERADRAPRSDEFNDLVTLLVGQEREQLARIEERLDDRDARRREIGEVLPDALLQHALDPELARALAPGVERAITASVRQNPAPLADALFPVMGPAIRKAVAAALASMVDTLNRTLELSFSSRSLSWRYESLRTGKSFAEIVLLHTLLYRVEQVFLIEPASGLLLQHVHHGDDQVRDVDMVSGMLTAIRDFVHDSFHVGRTDALESFKVGELSVWIEQGPRAVLAAVIRGEAPLTFRERLQSALETVHLEFADALENFAGDSAVFEASRPVLESCFQTEFRAGEKKSRTLVWALAAVVVAGLAVWVGLTWRARARWNDYVDTLNAEPGIVVVSSDRRGGRYVLQLLRDPLSRDPREILGLTAIDPSDVDVRWESFYTSNPTLSLERARQVLKPPPGATLDLRDGVLAISGSVSPAWLTDASRLSPLIPGIVRMDASAALDAAIATIVTRMNALTPLFVKGQAQVAAGQSDVVARLAGATEELQALAAASDHRFRVDVVGHTDADGAPEANLPLSRARAEAVKSTLDRVRGDRLAVVSSGVGSEHPVVQSQREADKQQNRRVTIHVTKVQ